MIDDKMQLNSIEFKHEITKLYTVIDDVARKDVRSIDDRTTKLEEAIHKLQQQQVEKFHKLETEFKFNINNIESKNMDIMNQAQNLKDAMQSMEQKTRDEPVSVPRNNHYTEPEVNNVK